jgi:tetratricopeptide (TPR) repeat protein
MELLVDDPARRLPSATILRDRLLLLVPSRRAETVPTLRALPPGTGYLDRAVSLLAEGRREEAREAASSATLHSTGLIPALELYARLSDELGFAEDAVKAYKRLLTLETTPMETRRTTESAIADLFIRLHRYEEAEAYVEAAIKRRECPRSQLFKAAVVLGACNKLSHSLELLNSILQEDPKDGAALEKKSLVLWLMHRYEESAQMARDVLVLMPDNESCLKRLGDYETLAGNMRRAQHYRERLLALGNG